MERLVKDGQEVYVSPESRYDYLRNGYEVPEAPEMSATDQVLSRAEALAAGRTFGLSGPVADLTTGLAGLAGGPDVPRAAGPGIDAPVSDESPLMREMKLAQAARQERAEGLGAERYAWEIAGGLAGGAPGASSALKMAPAALSETVGQKAAASILGRGAAAVGEAVASPTLLQTVGQRALGMGIEGAATAGTMAAAENVPQLIENPAEAVQDIGLTTLLGAGAGAGLGTVFGLGSHLAGRSAAKAEEGLAKLAAREAQVATPPDALAVAPELAQRAQVLAHQLPEQDRSLAKSIKDKLSANAGGMEEAQQNQGRAIHGRNNEFAQIDERLDEIVGNRAKKELNTQELKDHISGQLSDEVDPDEALKLGELQNRHAEAKNAFASTVAEQTAHKRAIADAIAEHDAARTALDAIPAKGFKPSRTARALQEEMGLKGLGDNEIPAARSRIDARLAEIEGELAAPATPERINHPDVLYSEKKGLPYFTVPKPNAKDPLDDPDGWARLALDEDPDLATVRLIATRERIRGKGVGTKLYSAMADFAESKGRKLASDVTGSRSPDAEAWWTKRVNEGIAHLDEAKQRYVLTGKIGQPAEDAAAKFAKRAQKLQQEAADLKELQGVMIPKSAREELTAKFKDAAARVKGLTKEGDALTARRAAIQEHFGQLNKELSATPEPRKLPKIEADTRAFGKEMVGRIREYASKLVGREADTANQFANLAEDAVRKANKEFAAGNYGEGYNILDQGLRRATGDFTNAAKTQGSFEFGKEIYKLPQSFLENQDTFGPAAALQARINPFRSQAALASNDPSFKGMWSNGGDLSPSGFGPGARSRSESVAGLVKGLGDQANDSAESAYKKAMTAKLSDMAERADALGDDEAKALASRAATIIKQNFDDMDDIAYKIRDKASMQGLATVGNAGARLVGLAGALSGNPVMGVGGVAGNALVSAVARTRVGVDAGFLRKTANLVAKTAKAGLSVLPRAARVAIPADARQRAIDDAQDMVKGGPALAAAADQAEALNQQAPGLGDHALQQKMQEAEYIVSKLPKPPSQALFTPPAKLTASQQTELDRVLAAVHNPGKAFDRIMAGEATAQDLEAMRTLYSAPYTRMVNYIMDAVSKSPDRIKSHTSKLYLSRVTGQPLTPALMNMLQNQERAKAATAGNAEQGKPQDGGDGMTARAPVSLDVNSVYAGRADQVMARG
jgi:hypothetical protein